MRKTYPMLVINEGRNDDEYFHVSNQDELLRAYIMIIKGWKSAGFFPVTPYKPYISEEDKDLNALTPEEFDALPPIFQERVSKARRTVAGILSDHAKFAQVAQDALKVVAAKNLSGVKAVFGEEAERILTVIIFSMESGRITVRRENLSEISD